MTKHTLMEGSSSVMFFLHVTFRQFGLFQAGVEMCNTISPLQLEKNGLPKRRTEEEPQKGRINLALVYSLSMLHYSYL